MKERKRESAEKAWVGVLYQKTHFRKRPTIIIAFPLPFFPLLSLIFFPREFDALLYQGQSLILWMSQDQKFKQLSLSISFCFHYNKELFHQWFLELWSLHDLNSMLLPIVICYCIVDYSINNLSKSNWRNGLLLNYEINKNLGTMQYKDQILGAIGEIKHCF